MGRTGWFPRFSRSRLTLADQPAEFVGCRRHASIHRRAPPSQCCIGVATDQDRDRLGGRRVILVLGMS